MNMDTLDTVELEDDTRVKTCVIGPTIELDCEVSDEPFEAHLTIKYKHQGEVIELVSLNKWLNEFEKETIESLVDEVKKGLEKKLDGVKVDVSGRAISDIHPETTVKTWE
jgi:NADPH-dependent 7-cyano-7-deazaguanine reductase QueF